MKILLVLASLLILSACSDSMEPAAEKPKQKATGNHVWKTQTDTIDKARGVEQTILESSTRAREQADQQ